MTRFLRVFIGIVFIAALVYLFGLSRNKSFIFDRSEVSHKANFSKGSEILFVGDIMFARKIASLIEERGLNYPFELIKDRLTESDMVIANLEGPISSRGRNQGSIYSFRFKPEIVSALREVNIGAVSLANNHIWDWGSDALADTLLHLENAGIKFAGAGLDYESANEPAIFQLGKDEFALFSFTNLYPSSLEARESGAGPPATRASSRAMRAGISDFDLMLLEQKIKKIREAGVDVVIVSFHWGQEYETRSSVGEQLIARKMIDSGVDLVIGHHPHVVQEVEEYLPTVIPEYSSGIQMDLGSIGRDAKRVGYIAYSLGNFIFDQNFSKDTSNGLMLSVKVKGGKIEAVEPISVCFNALYQPFEC